MTDPVLLMRLNRATSEVTRLFGLFAVPALDADSRIPNFHAMLAEGTIVFLLVGKDFGNQNLHSLA